MVGPPQDQSRYHFLLDFTERISLGLGSDIGSFQCYLPHIIFLQIAVVFFQ